MGTKYENLFKLSQISFETVVWLEFSNDFTKATREREREREREKRLYLAYSAIA